MELGENPTPPFPPSYALNVRYCSRQHLLGLLLIGKIVHLTHSTPFRIQVFLHSLAKLCSLSPAEGVSSHRVGDVYCRERGDISCDETRFQRKVNLLFILAFTARQDEKQAGMPIIFLLNESVGT